MTMITLIAAESFIRGFEDDPLQEGIAALLADLRAAIAAPPEKTWNYSQLESAMCLYEAMDHATDDDETPGGNPHPQWLADLRQAWDNNGSMGMQYIAAGLAHEVAALWDTLDGGANLMDGISFDWEFAEDLLQHVLWAEIDSDQVAKLKPDVLETMTKWRDDKQEKWRVQVFNQHYPDLDAYKAALTKAAGRQWGYPELITEEGVDSVIGGAFAEQIDPEVFVEEQGKEHDLNEPDPITLKDLARIYQ